MNILILKNNKIASNHGDKEICHIKEILTKYHASFVEYDISDDIKDVDKDISMVIAIGGDGTIIKGAKVAFSLHVPVCGINAGHLGYLSGINIDEDIETNIKKILDGKYTIDSRALLDVEVIDESGKTTYKDVAINEAESLSSDLNNITNFKISLDTKDKILYDFSSCGLLISTPTGSTGFSFSAGGPIVSPKVRCLVVQAIYPHAFNQRAFVVEDDKPLFVVIPDYNQSLYIDGQKLISLQKNDTIKVVVGKSSVGFISLTDNVFYKNLKNKIRSI